MAVNVFCPECKSSYAVGVKKSCRKCGNNLQKNRKYRIFIKEGDKRVTRIVDTLELARKLETKLKENAIKKTELGIVAAPTLDSVWKQFHAYLNLNTKSAGYYEKFWRVHIKPEFTGKNLDTITPTDLDNFTLKLQAKTHKLSPNAKNEKVTKTLAPSTIANILKTIRRLYDFALQKRIYIGGNPTRDAALPKYDNRMTNSLNDNELKSLLAVLRSWPNRKTALGLLMCLITGKRTGEVFGLTWGDVDFESGIVRFQIKSRVNGECQFLPMNDLCHDVLTQAKDFQIPGCFLVFHTKTGKPIHYRSIWLRIKEKAGLRDIIRPHDLRHTFASRLASSGNVDIYVLQNLLGHKNISMTKRYAHLLDDALKNGICVADKIFA